MIDEKFMILGALLSVIGSFSYLRDTLKGKTQPNRVSWFLWALAPLIAFSAEVKSGVGWVALMTFMVGFNPLVIFLASFVNRKSSWKLSRLDVVCGVLSLIGIVLWQLTGSGFVAILFCILADALAGVPTVVKSYKEPETENWHIFFVAGMNATIALFVIDTWDFAHWGFPVYILLLCAVLVALIKFKLGLRRKPVLAKVIVGEDEQMAS